jgi:hypothetical protein
MDLFSDTPAPCLVDGNPCGAPGAFWRTQDILSEQIPADDSISLTTSREPPNQALLDQIVEKLDDDKAEDIVTIDMAGKSAMCDFMVIASGRSQRQVSAMAEHLAQMLKPQMPANPLHRVVRRASCQMGNCCHQWTCTRQCNLCILPRDLERKPH